MLLLDLDMEKMDGFAALKALQSSNEAPAMVVALTGFADRATREKCLAAGFHHHEIKPMSLDRLRELVADARQVCGDGLAKIL